MDERTLPKHRWPCSLGEGDEFAILLDCINEADANKTAEIFFVRYRNLLLLEVDIFLFLLVLPSTPRLPPACRSY
ncbi:MAG: hypothetical protein ACJA0C_000060 [Candidatus Endobugula sp.]